MSNAERRIGLEDRQGYDGTDRRSWQIESAVLHDRLDNIERLVKETQALAMTSCESMKDHIVNERETKAAIDELLTLWRGSKLMVAGIKFIIPIVAAIITVAIWAKDHWK